MFWWFSNSARKEDAQKRKLFEQATEVHLRRIGNGSVTAIPDWFEAKYGMSMYDYMIERGMEARYSIILVAGIVAEYEQDRRENTCMR